MKNKSLLIVLLIFAGGSSFAQDLAGGAEIRDENRGFRFVLPEDWVGQQTEEGYLLGSNTLEGLMFVLPHASSDPSQIRREMQRGVVEQNGTDLQLQSTIEPFGDDGFAANYEGTMQYQRVRAHVISRASPHGRGITVMVVTVPEAYKTAHTEAARALARGIRFFEPETPPVVREWEERITGRRLSKYSRYSGSGGGGSTSRTHIHLCTAGHFFYEDSQQASFNSSGSTSGYVAGDRAGAGTWEVTARLGEPVLRLEFHDGEVWEYELGWGNQIPASSARYTSLNGSDYLRTPSDRPGCGT